MHALLQYVDWHALVLPALVPLFLILLLAESIRFRGRRWFSLRDTLASLTLGALYLVFDGLITVTLVALIFHAVYHHRLTTIDITPWSFPALLILVEFCYYVFHRASHRIRWFWATHVTHHSSDYLNFSTGLRQNPLYSLAGAWLFFLPLAFLGFKPAWIFLMLSVNLGYQYFVHTRSVSRLHPAIEYLFNTPSHHRVHHASNPEYRDRNYGGILVIFDRLFGTFADEQDAVPPEYGLRPRISGFNPLRLTGHEWVALFRDAARPGPLKHRLKHLWASPEWRRPEDRQR